MTQIFIQLLWAGGPPGQQGGNTMLFFLPAMFIVMWLFLIRPQNKKAKEQQQYINNLQKGDKVVTIAGIHGVINKVNDDGTLQLEINPGSYIKIERSAISKEWSDALNKASAGATK
jgi:preprotein translocase subunit YajC